MNCPVCKTAMIVLEYEQVEVDFCVECGGIWLDGGELALLYGDQAAADAFLASGDAARSVTEKPRRCPVCRVRMDKRTAAQAPPVVYDHCPAGDGLWFDRGELALILEQGSTAPGGAAVVGWLRELFPAPESAPTRTVLPDAGE